MKKFIPTLSSLFVLAAFTLSCGSPSSAAHIKSANEPHLSTRGPWFEGWYARVTDLGGGRSLAVIAASNLVQGQEYKTGDAVPGYIGVLYSEGNGQPTRSWTFYPQKTAIRVNGQVVTQNPNIFNARDQDFEWTAEGYGSYSSKGLSIDVPGELKLNFSFEESKSWELNQTGGLPLGPEGYLAVLPVPLHWYVSSLSSKSHYHIETFGDHAIDIEGDGLAHLEKNWGKVFPKAWNWMQGLSVADNAQFVLGGGKVGLGPVELTAWLAGYRSPTENWTLRFSDLGTRIETQQDPCQGHFRLKASRPGLEVVIDAKADQNTFGPVAVPTHEGFKSDYGAESFSARLEVKTYRFGLRGKYLSDERIFQNAALEFGAESYCPQLSR